MKIPLVVSSAAVLVFVTLPFAVAKEPTAPPAPLPTQIVNAKKIFISNAGEDNRDGAYNGGADRTYNQFYAAMKSWGHYELASTPADADLIFEISFTIPGEFENAYVDFKGVAYVHDPQFRLVIFEPKTHITLWAFSEHAGLAILAGNRNRNFDQALNRIVTDVKALTDQAVATNRQP